MHAGSISDGEILLRLAVVVVLCGAIGLEREAREQTAGLRTHVIVGLGSALFTLVSAYGFTASTHVDPTRIAAQIVSGIGFLGGGMILRYGMSVRGVTTAAALWISAAIGMAAAGRVLPWRGRRRRCSRSSRSPRSGDSSRWSGDDWGPRR